MAKKTCEESKALSIAFLNSQGFFSGVNKSGLITWRSFRGESTVWISFCLSGETYMRVRYALTDLHGNQSEYDYNIRLTTTSCNFGGVRYWFVCPSVKNSVQCSRRVGVIYIDRKYFACRCCHRLTYSSQHKYSSRRLSRLIERK
jgi:hypothetical protein